MKSCFWFFFIGFLFCSLLILGQNTNTNAYGKYYEIKKYTVDDGLLSNEINKVTQDKKGLLWISNGRGYSAFDGKTFKNFILKKNLYPESEIIENDNCLYTNFDEGIIKLNYFNLSITEIDRSLLKIYDHEVGAYRQNQLLMDKDGYTLLSKHPYKDKVVDTICYFKNLLQSGYFVFDLNKKDTFSLSIINDNRNISWFSVTHKNSKNSSKLMSLFYFENGKIISFIRDIPYFKHKKIFRSSKNEIYLVSVDNVCKIDKNKKIKIIDFNYLYKSRYTANFVEDSKGNLWAGYYKGLIKITENLVQFIENPKRKIKPTKEIEYSERGEKLLVERYPDANYVTAVKIDSKDNIVSANEIYDGNNFTIVDIGSDAGVFIDKQDQIWFNTINGLICAKETNVKQLDLKKNICFVSKNGEFIITYNLINNFKNEALYLYKNFKLCDSITIKINDFNEKKIYELMGNIFIISSGGIYKIFNNKFQIQSLQPKSVKTKVSSFNYVDGSELPLTETYTPKGLFVDSNNNLWGLTASKGYLFKTDGKEWSYFGEEDGIKDTIIEINNMANKSCNYIFTTNGIYYFFKEKFCLVKNSKKYFKDIRLIGQIGNSFYFSHLIYGVVKKCKIFSITNNVLEEYTTIIKDNSSLYDNYPWYLEFKNDYLSVNLNTGFTKQIINKKNKSIENSFFYSDPTFIPQAPSFHYLNNKLIVFDDAGPVQVYDTKNMKSDTLPKPVLIKDFAHFVDLSYLDTLGNVYATTFDHKSIMLNSKDNFQNTYIPKTYFLRVNFSGKDSVETVYDLDKKIELPYNFTPLTINYKAVCLTDGEKLSYRYKLTGIDKNWNETKEDNIVYSSLPAGTYTFEVKACNNDGLWDTTPSQIVLQVSPPWYKTWLAYSIYVLAGFGLIVLYVRSRTRSIEKEKEKLEETVRERTSEIVEQKHLIEEKNKEITDSINYAQKIQSTLMASDNLLNTSLVNKNEQRDYFVFYQPKDIVSGDYYWAFQPENEPGNFIMITADCTGHGVPGAFMSLLCISYLNEIIKEQHITQPNLIFNQVRDKIVSNFKANENPERKDGMDAALCKFNFKELTLEYAAGNNPVIIVEPTNHAAFELKELPYDKMPVGVSHNAEYTSFTNYSYQLKKGSLVYTITDGFSDQFGGPKGKKFMYKNLRELILNNAALSMAEQREKLKEGINTWKGDLEQVDDICIVGIKI